jgi:hypothetical protein
MASKKKNKFFIFFSELYLFLSLALYTQYIYTFYSFSESDTEK